MASRWLTVASILWLLPAIGIRPAVAETAAQRCEEIGRGLAAGISTERARPSPDAMLLGGLLNPAKNAQIEPLTGFESADEFPDISDLQQYLAPAVMSGDVLQHPSLSSARYMTAYDLRKRLDRVVVVEPGSKPACASVTTLARDRQSQQIFLATPAISCEAQSAHVIKLKDGGTFVALLDLPRERLEAITAPTEHAYGLTLYGVGKEDENTTCRFRLTTDAMSELQVEKAKAINDLLWGALIAAGPVSPEQKAIQNWLQRHGAEIAEAYVDRMSGLASDMSWPQDVLLDGIVLAEGPLDMSKGECGIFRRLPAGQALRMVVQSITDLGGIQCVPAAADRTLHGRVKTGADEFLVSVSSDAGIVYVNGYTWNANKGTAQLAALLRAREIPSTRKIIVTRVESE